MTTELNSVHFPLKNVLMILLYMQISYLSIHLCSLLERFMIPIVILISLTILIRRKKCGINEIRKRGAAKIWN